MHLSHFQHLISLSLDEFHFQTFWDLRRFIIALPVISSLTLDDVTWPEFSNDLRGVPSLPFIPSSLQTVYCEEVTASHEILWFWVTSRTPPLSLKDQREVEGDAKDRCFTSAFTIKDAVTVGHLLNKVGDDLEYQWSYKRETQYYNLTIKDIFPSVLGLTLISFDLETTALTTTQGPQKKCVPACLEFDIGRIRAYTVKFEFDSIAKSPWFSALDQLCCDLESLQKVDIHPDHKMRSDWGHFSPKELTQRFQYVVTLLPLLRDRATRGDLSLTFILNERDEFPWPPEMEIGADEDTASGESLEFFSEESDSNQSLQEN